MAKVYVFKKDGKILAKVYDETVRDIVNEVVNILGLGYEVTEE